MKFLNINIIYKKKFYKIFIRNISNKNFIKFLLEKSIHSNYLLKSYKYIHSYINFLFKNILSFNKLQYKFFNLFLFNFFSNKNFFNFYYLLFWYLKSFYILFKINEIKKIYLLQKKKKVILKKKIIFLNKILREKYLFSIFNFFIKKQNYSAIKINLYNFFNNIFFLYKNSEIYNYKLLIYKNLLK